MSYLRHTARQIGTPPQSQPLDSKQVPNSAGGYSYAVDSWKQLERFLILGSEGGSYYASEKKLTFENVKSLDECLKLDGPRTVALIVNVSDRGRAPKNDPALFALAYCMSKGSLETRRAAEVALPAVARIGTHLFHFAEYAQSLRGWGAILKRSVDNWYRSMPTERLAEQVIKYRQRDGWTHRDLLRLSKPAGLPEQHSAIAYWVTKGKALDNLPGRIRAHIQLQEQTSPKAAASIIREATLTWESVPTDLLKSPEVWEALLERMPLTALIRNLGRLTSLNVLKPLSEYTKNASRQLNDVVLLKKARVHPLLVLNALRTYQQGHGDKGSLSWTPVTQISRALEEAFYLAFDCIEPSNKNFYFGLDVSGSMSSPVPGTSISCREGTAVMSMVSVRREPFTYVRGFCDKFVDLPITARTSLEEAINIVYRSDFGGTDCALPMLDATQRKLEVDTFVVMTDNETWKGKIHPKQALEEYRQKMGRPARLVVVGMVANKFSIADPSDLGMLDCCGFDTSTPALISEFSR